MRIFRRIAGAVCAVMAAVSIGGCQVGEDAPEVQMFSSSDAVLDPETDTVYFSFQQQLYSWPVGGERAEMLSDDLFYMSERRRMAVLDGKVYTVRWDTGVLTVFDPETGENTELAEVFDWEQTHFCGDIWVYDGKICNVYQEYFGENAEIQIRSVDGELVETIPLPVNWVYPCFAYGKYFFYTDSNAFGPGHVVNLDTGEDTLLGVYQPLDIADGKLLVLEQGVYDENGEYHRTDEWNYYLMDKAGKVEPYAWPEEGFWVETDVYYSRGGILYGCQADEPEELLSFGRHLPATRGMVDGVLVMRSGENMELTSDRITMVDATGENAERVAEANETRHFLVGTDTVTLALMPDGTLYLLQAGEPETGWCVVTG